MFKTKEEFIEHLCSLDLSTLPPEMVDKVTLFLENEAVASASKSFYKFVLLMGPLLVDNFRTGRHIEVICEELQKLSVNIWKNTGLTNRLMISLPPGGMKSQLCTRMFPAWLLGRYPKIRMLIIGHGLEFAKDEFGAKIRDILRMEEYQKIFPGTEMREDKATAGRFLIKGGGEVVCTSLESKVAGRRAHIAITDDAVVEEDAASKAVRNKLVRKYMPNIRSRLLMTPDCAELMVGTRWTQGDLFDYLLEEDKTSTAPWKTLVIPAILDEGASKVLRRKGDPPDYLTPGTSFWPEFQPTKRLEMIRSSFVNQMSRWNAVYQQNPTPEEGQLINPTDFVSWRDSSSPNCHTILITADTAYTTNTQSDFTAYQVWGLFNRTENTAGMGGGIPDKEVSFDEEGMPMIKHSSPTSLIPGGVVTTQNAILLDAKKGKWDFHELCSIFEDLNRRRRPDYFVIEERSSGLAIIPELRKRRLPIHGWKTEKDKMARMQAAAPIVKSGCIWVPMPPESPEVCQKTSEFVAEICMFPGGNHDDVADAFSQFILFCRDNNLLYSSGTSQEFMTDGGDSMEDDFHSSPGFASYTSALLRRNKR